jgi:PAS domain S-box-containing protein
MSPHDPGSSPEDKPRFLERIAESMREVIWTTDVSGETLYYVNPAYERVAGRPVDELYRSPESWLDLVHPDDRSRVRIFGALDAAEEDSTEFRIVRPDEDLRWLWLHRTSVKDDGVAIGVVGVVEDITERKRAELALRRSESLLRAALDSTADGILIVDLQGHVSGLNRRFLDLWRIPDSLAAERDDDDLLAHVADQLVDPEGFLDRVRQVYDTPAAESFDVVHFRDGRVFERYSRPQILDEEFVGRVWSFRDVTARWRAEAEMRARNRRLDIQTQVLFDLARCRTRHGADLSAMLPEITQAAASMLETERVGVWLFDAAHARIRETALYERSRRRHSAGRELDRESFPRYFAALEHERTIAANDPRTDVRTQELTAPYLVPLGITSMLDAPIRDGGGLSGVVCFEHVGAPRRWTAEDRTFAGSIADLVSISMEAVELRRAEDGVRLLLEASGVLASSLDYRTTLNNVARLAVPTLADWCVVSVIEDGELRRHAMAHVDPEKERLIAELESRYPEARASTPAAHVIRTGEPEFVPVVTEEALADRTLDAGHRRIVQELGARSYMAVPLIARGTTLGAITFASGGRTLDAHDLELAKDIAARSAIAIDNARLHAQVVEAGRAKDNFLAVMSHELRTPLSAITGYAALLEEGIPDPCTSGQKRHLHGIRANAARLLRVIEEILEFSRLEMDETRFHFEEVDLGRLVEDTRLTGEPLATERGLEFAAQVPPRPARIRTDPEKVRQILLHLLVNAVSFTPEGKIRLTADARDGLATFQVTDTGVGIPPELHEKIFEPFFQAVDPLTREVGGTGIGLAVARGLARRLGGDVTVESRPGAGSTFTLTIPDLDDAGES